LEDDKAPWCWEELLAALEAVQRRRKRINEALGYEFVGEYVDKALEGAG
jgi:hypothetical protein